MISAKEVARRARVLEEKGLEIEVIGRKPLPFKVQKQRAFQRFVQHLVFGDSGREVGITVSGVPRFKGRRISLSLTLDIPLDNRKLRLSKVNKKLLETLLVQAIEERARLLRSESTSRQSRHRTTHRRASTGS